MANPIFWMIYIALIFWAFYQKWDEKQNKYIEYPYGTTIYFLVASAVLTVFFPYILTFFKWDTLGVSLLVATVSSTYILYKLLRFLGAPNNNWPFFDYFLLLDTRYIIPKLAEIIFQQVFFVSIFIISLETFGEVITIWLTVLAFILAHLNLFLFKGRRQALFYFSFSVLGAPTFILLIANTEVLWHSISIHMMFYTFLAVLAWIWGKVKR